MPITALPAPPSRSDPPAEFVAKADAFLAALQTFVAEVNAAAASINITQWISGTTYAVGDVVWSPADFQAYVRKTAGAGTTDPSADTTNWQFKEVSPNALQMQRYTAFTTAGTAPNFTLAPTPALTAYGAGQRFRVKFHAAGAGSDQLNVSSLGNKSLKQYGASGAKIPAIITSGLLADLEYDGTDVVVLDPLPASQAGEIAFFARNTAPTGYLKANGAAVSRTTYAALFAAIGTTFGTGDGSTTFNLPDLRGEFPRFWDDGRGVDSGRTFGSAQSENVGAHSHGIPAGLDVSYNAGGIARYSPGSGSSGGGTIGNPSGENRPRNIALLACIKY